MTFNTMKHGDVSEVDWMLKGCEVISVQKIGAGITNVPYYQIASQCTGNGESRAHALEGLIVVSFLSQNVI